MVICTSLIVRTKQNKRKGHEMTDITMVLMELLRKHELNIDSDFLREGIEILMQMLIELEAGQQIGAGRCEDKVRS